MKAFSKKPFYAALASLVVLLAGTARAGELALSETPLFLANAVEPNIFFLVDDSGSMEWEVLIDGGGGSGIGVGLNFAYYVLPSPDNGQDQAYLPSYPYVVSDEGTISGQGLWRLRNTDFNALYYDPAIQYKPWAGTDTSGNPLYGNATPGAALADPSNAAAGTLNLTSNITFTNYRFDSNSWYTETIYPATYYTWTDSDADGVVDASDAHTRVTIQSSVNAYQGGSDRFDCAAAPVCTYAEEIQNFANWYSYYRKRSLVARAGVGAVIDDANAVRSGLRVYNDGLRQSILSLSSTTNKQTLLERLYDTDFECAAYCLGTPARGSMADLGAYFQGESSPILSASRGGECQQNFSIVVTDGYWNGVLTTTQATTFANDDGDNDTAFDGGVYADLQSETLADIAMFYYENDLKPLIDNEVPTIAGVDEASHQHLVTYSVAFGVVGTMDPFDTKTPGVATDTDPTATGFSWPTITSNTDTTVDDLWHAAYNGRGQFLSARDPEAMIRAINDVIKNISDRTSSSGSVAVSSGYLSTDSLLFQAIMNSAEWTGQLLAYNVVASGSDAGKVGSVAWDAGCMLTGGACEATDGSETGLDWDGGRTIVTYKPSTSAGIAFRWPNNPSSPSTTELDVSQVAALKTHPVTGASESDTIGENRLKYLRGADISGMRVRSSLLGDIINSNPVYVGAPSYAYPDGLESVAYSSFATAYANRKPMVYVGANDGMLHGFYAVDGTNGGTELLAYIPSTVYRDLPALTTEVYGGNLGHRTFVDGPPTAADVFTDGAWRTVLVGGLRKGGQSIYALDITNPDGFSEADAANIVLWEFDDGTDVDIGYTYAQPPVVRLANGKWAAVVGNGYNNTDTDGGADSRFSSTGNGVLYLLDMEDGSIIRKFDTGVGTADDPTGAARPNGLTIPAPVDLDGDRIVDYIYVADLFGNIWKVDVRDVDATNWGFSFYSGGNPQPFFVAKDASGVVQPITARIEIGLHPTHSGQFLLFGTGKYIEDGDNASSGQQTQTVYGIWDRNESSNALSQVGRDHLLEQQIIEETVFGTRWDVRISTTTPINWFLGTGLPGSGAGYLGWYMDLLNTEGGNTNNYGERVVATPVLRDGKIIFVTLMPLPDPCDPGGDSWLMEIDAYSGARLPVSPFDLNGDGLFSFFDLVADNTGNNVVASGVKSKVGILPGPGIMKDSEYGQAGGVHGGDGSGGGREFKYFSGSSGEIQTITENRGNSNIGRQSWREVPVN